MTHVGEFLRGLRTLVGPTSAGDVTDTELLDRFVQHREESAFSELVRRHGAVVLGVCQRVLHHPQDAEDAFQATFLVLVRKAASIRTQASVGSWLHGVAFRIATKAVVQAARRQTHESKPRRVRPPDLLDEVTWREVRPVLDEELDRLPEKYRAPLVLSYLEGKSNEEVARQLGWTKGTVSGRLAQARDLVRGRLARRGLGMSAGALCALLGEQAARATMSARLLDSTIQAGMAFAAGQTAAGGAISVPVVSLAQGALHSMFVSKLKMMTLAVILAVAVMGAGIGVFTHEPQASGMPLPAAEQTTPGRTEPSAVTLEARLTLPPAKPPGLLRHMAFSPDGKTLAVSDASHVWLWEVGRKEARQLGTARGSPWAFAPDGKTLLTQGRNLVVSSWDVAAGKALRQFVPEGEYVGGFLGDTTTLFTGDRLGAVRFWNSTTGKKEQEVQLPGLPKGEYVAAIRVSPDGRYVLFLQMVSGRGTASIRLWDASAGKMLHQSPQFQWQGTHSVSPMSFSPDGKTLASVSEDGRMRFLSVREEMQGPLIALKEMGAALDMVFSPDGKAVAWSKPDGTMHLWERATCQQRCRLVGDRVLALAFSADGRFLATSGLGHTVQVWNLWRGDTGKPQPGKQPSVELGEKQWTELAATDAAAAWQTMSALVAAPRQTIPWLEARLVKLSLTDHRRIAQWITDLDSDEFAVRQRASEELATRIELAEPQLRKALEGKPFAEVRSRVAALLAPLDRSSGDGSIRSPELLRVLRSVEVLEAIGTAEARQALETVVRKTADTWTANEARAALGRLARRAAPAAVTGKTAPS